MKERLLKKIVNEIICLSFCLSINYVCDTPKIVNLFPQKEKEEKKQSGGGSYMIFGS